MAIDTSIFNLTQGGVPNVNLMSSLQQGLQARQAIRMAPLLEEIQKAKLAQAQRIAATGGAQKFIGTPQRVTREGRDYLVGLVQNPNGGISLSETPVQGEFVSVLGETASEEEARRVREARQKANIGVEAAGQKVSTVKQKERVQTAIETGLDAIDPVSDVARALELLDIVKTGRPQEALLAAKQKFGIEAADEGELRAILGKTLISGLRLSFGGNPTEGERSALAEVEAAFSQQGEVNRRLLNRTMDKLERRIRRGLAAAEKEGDDFSAERLNAVLGQIEQIRGVSEKEKAPGLPSGTVDNKDGTFTLPNGQVVRKKR